MPTLINILDVCTEPEILKVILYIQIILKYVFIIVPIGLILMMGFDFFKNVTAGREEDMKKNLSLAIKRLIFCVCMFFVPTIVSLVINIVNDSIEDFSVDYQSCLDNTKYIDYYEKIAEEEKAKEEEDLNKKIEEQKKKQQEEDEAIRVSVRHSTSGGNSSTGTSIGQKYQLTDSQLRGLAMICQREQGTVDGAKAEASLMANRFELFGSNYGTGGNGLYNYVAGSGWFGSGANSYMANTSGLKSEILGAVKEVLVLGKRTLDPYVDEHDCIDCGSYGFDIVKIITNGSIITDHSALKNHNNYKKNNTIIYNKYGSIYTFSTFPTSNSDPFGYTEIAKNKYNSLNNR